MKLYDNNAYREEFTGIVYSLLQSDGTNDRANQIIDAFDMAPEAEADPLLPNDPLTLEELWEMDGEPVWVKEIVDDMEENWGIITVSERGLFARTLIGSYSRCTYGYHWLAYRRKPEEGTA